MPSTKPAVLPTLLLISLTAIPLMGCQTTSSGTEVAAKSLRMICLSRKDTEGTKRQVVVDNAAKLALGVKKRKCK